MTGRLRQISVGKKNLWGLNEFGMVFKCKKPCVGNWDFIPGNFTSLGSGNKYVWAVNPDGKIYRKTESGSDEWIQIVGNLKQISGVDPKYVWGVDDTNSVFYCKNPCLNGNWKKIPGDITMNSVN